jgi:Kelch motif
LDFSSPFPAASSFLILKLLIMKSKIPWQYAAILLFSLISLDCKKDINQKEMARLTQDDGSATTLGITCISNGIQFFKTESLSQAREFSMGIGLSNKVLFVGGNKLSGNEISARVDIYNTISDSWTDKILKEGTLNNAVVGKVGQALAAGGTKIGIAGGEIGIDGPLSDRVDIYDVNSDLWTISHLSVPRVEAAGVGYGDSLYFAGGSSGGKNRKSIDVYNTLNGSWSKLSLSLARFGLAAAAINNQILFAGGVANAVATDRVDIYNVRSGTWTVSALSVARTGVVGAALGNLIIFGGGNDPNGNNGGGHPYNIIDIYNTSTGQWSVTHISSAAGWTHSAVQGTKMFFGGSGNSSGPSVVDVYDICSNTWSKLSLTDGRAFFGAGAAGGKVLFGGGNRNNSTLSEKVDIFNLGPLIEQ